MQEIQNLLSQISTVIKKNNEYLDSFGGRFNMFSVVGVNHYETIHSAILAEFLNPSGSHGLKDAFLKEFIQGIELDFNFKTSNAKVQTEAATDDGRIDIRIDDNSGNVVIIENKIYAGDQPEQLIRYDKFLNKSNINYRIIYLTLFGEKPSEQSSQGVAFIPISYSENIINWMEKCVSIAARFPTVRETIIQYINHLKQLTNQDMNTINQKEVVDILLKPENIEASMKIIDNSAEFYKGIVTEYLTPALQKIANTRNLIFNMSIDFKNGNKGEYFQFYKEEWNHLSIRFIFDNYNYNGFYWCLHSRTDNDRFTEAKCKDVGLWNFGCKSELKPYGDKWHYYKQWKNDAFLDIISGKFMTIIENNIEDTFNLIKEDASLIL